MRTFRNILMLLTIAMGLLTAIGGPVLIYVNPELAWLSFTAIFVTVGCFLAFAFVDLRLPVSPFGYMPSTPSSTTEEPSFGFSIGTGMDIQTGNIVPSINIGATGLGPSGPTIKL